MPTAVAAVWIAGASAAVGAVSYLQQRKEAKSARKDREKETDERIKGIEEQKKRDAIQASRQRRQTAREGRIKRAQILATSGAQGLGASSGAQGGVGSVSSQVGSQVGFIGQVEDATQKANQFNINAAGFAGSAATHQSNAASWGALSSLSGSVFNSVGGYNTLAKAF